MISREDAHFLVDYIFQLNEQMSKKAFGDDNSDALNTGDSWCPPRAKTYNEAASLIAQMMGYLQLQLADYAIGCALINEIGASIQRTNDDMSDVTLKSSSHFLLSGRKVIAEFIKKNFVLPSFVSNILADNLSALEFGETPPFLTPRTLGLHGNPYSLSKAKLKAVRYIRFKHGYGDKLDLARQEVSAATNVDIKTLRSWEVRDLPKIFGKDYVAEETEDAKIAGRAARMGKINGRDYRNNSLPLLTPEIIGRYRGHGKPIEERNSLLTRLSKLISTMDEFENFDLEELRKELTRGRARTE